MNNGPPTIDVMTPTGIPVAVITLPMASQMRSIKAPITAEDGIR